MEEWLTYAPADSLQYFMFQKPRTAKRLYFDVVPKAVDELVTFTSKTAAEPIEKLVENPAFHVYEGALDEARARNNLPRAELRAAAQLGERGQCVRH